MQRKNMLNETEKRKEIACLRIVQEERKLIDETHAKGLEMLLRESAEERLNKEKECIGQKKEFDGRRRNEVKRVN